MFSCDTCFNNLISLKARLACISDSNGVRNFLIATLNSCPNLSDSFLSNAELKI